MTLMERDRVTNEEVAQRLDTIAEALKDLRERLDTHIADSQRERRVLSDALVIIQEDADLYNSQFVNAFTRLGDKINDLSRHATHLHEVTRRQAAGASPVAQEQDMANRPLIESRPARPIPRLEKVN